MKRAYSLASLFHPFYLIRTQQTDVFTSLSGKSGKGQSKSLARPTVVNRGQIPREHRDLQPNDRWKDYGTRRLNGRGTRSNP